MAPAYYVIIKPTPPAGGPGGAFNAKWGVGNSYWGKEKERCYVYNIFTTNHRWLVVISSNLKLTLRLLFCPNNNNQ